MNIFRRAIRWTLSRAANLTPGVFYYAKHWPVKVNDQLTKIASQRDGYSSPMTVAAISLCCAMHENLKIGDTATIELNGVTQGGTDIGNFVVTLQRI